MNLIHLLWYIRIPILISNKETYVVETSLQKRPLITSLHEFSFFINPTLFYRSPRIPTVRRIPVQKAPSMDDRSITELSIHDMQMVMMHPDASSFLSRSLSESDLSEIGPIGGASGSGTQSPVQMMAPSDDDNDSTGKLWKNFVLRRRTVVICM